MSLRTSPYFPAGLVYLVAVLAATESLSAATRNYGLSFSTNQSVWQSGPSGGFNRSGQFGSSAGISYSAVASSGTVSASVGGQLRVQHPDAITPGSTATIDLSFDDTTNGGSISSSLGAAVDVNGFIPCVATIPFTNICAHPRNFSLIDAGLFVNPSRTFTPRLDTSVSASDVDNAIGFGPNIDLIIGELGAEANVDLSQSISFTPTGLTGTLAYEHRATGATGSMPFSVPNMSNVQVDTSSLGPGVWDFTILSAKLGNSFRNNIDLDIRPTINYVFGEWPPVGSPLFSVGLIDETFSLGFNTISQVGAFTIDASLPADFNADLVSDIDDINLLLSEGPVSTGVAVTLGQNEQFDLTGDGLIDNQDVDLWLSNAAANNGLASPYKRGDANLDGVVDGADFLQWNANRFSVSSQWDHGDFTGDGTVDGLDFAQWNAVKFTSSDTLAAVPEPQIGMLSMLMLGLVGLLRRA